MAGDFFAEPFNIFIFSGVLGALTFMISGCYVYHKWRHAQRRNAPDIVPQKPRKKLKRFLRKASGASERRNDEDMRQMELEAANNFTPASTPGDVLNYPGNLDDDVFLAGANSIQATMELPSTSQINTVSQLVLQGSVESVDVNVNKSHSDNAVHI